MSNIRVANVVTTADPDRQGEFWVRLLGDDENSKAIPVSYTTPTFAPPTGASNSKFTGYVGVPGEGAYVLICSNQDDNKWYYLSTITGSDNYWDLDKRFGNTTITGGPEGKYTKPFPFSEDPETSVYSHDIFPQKYGIESPQGGKLQISDSANPKDLQYYTKLESMTNKKFIADDVSDYIAMENEHGDGLKISSSQYEGQNGPRSAELRADQNVFLESNEGSLNADVLGGYQLNVRNKSANTPSERPIRWDPKVGEVNIESTSNSVNITTHGREFKLYPESQVEPSKGVFIDASQYQGVVQIKAGKGGVEIWSDGDIDFNCNGNFNVNAVGDINLTGKSPLAKTYWETQKNPAVPSKFLNPPGPLGLINLNNPVGYTEKVVPTPNNDLIYLAKGGFLIP